MAHSNVIYEKKSTYTKFGIINANLLICGNPQNAGNEKTESTGKRV